ncbi:hypothetical protein GR168_13150 [Gordonia sp. JH63]|uniref:hypothetical protein n=1 Tax=unclassified Gordonia (in: high G+C Gram-positive bacteria) TaxID=2657482 RepID=UPI00131F4B29|nr:MULTISPECIES: hypothetical protein [unclassified Gordonia (in: high G+C Gram-positive bacteria)]MBR7193302.1 hypothetical protein [Gordonia sp. SCSIO 19800]MCX2754861.1 hypothetical protein [Gordonia sp. 4N]QHD86213.1 hypothetical protein GR168_13150 [Gordonia sp. JH63]
MSRRRRIVVFGGVAAVLAVVLVAALVVGLAREDERAATPSEAVQTYLDALADADADAALGVIDPRPDTRFLSDNVLRAQRAAAPLGDIEVRSAADGAPEENVRARYRMGARVIDTEIRTVRVADGWAVVDGAIAVRIESLRVVQPTFFGGEVEEGDTVHVFPGPQRWGSRDTDFVARVADDDPPTTPRGPMSVRVVGELSATGAGAVSASVSAHLTACAASTQADAGRQVAGCTQRLYRSAVDGSVRWTAPKDLSGLRYLIRVPVSDASGDSSRDGSGLGVVDVVGPVRWRVSYTPEYDADGPRVETVDEQYLVGHVDLTESSPEFVTDG